MSKLSDIILSERYLQQGETCWADVCKRLSTNVAKIETDYDKWEPLFYKELESMNFIPGGRIIANAGKAHPHMLNCNLISVDDNRESIGQMLKDLLVISGTGGGVGCSFSKVRYKGAEIKTVGGQSSGTISFMKCADMVAGTIKTGGGRRAALMISLSVYHPDIIDFLHEKLDLHTMNNANVSVEIDNKFIQAVKDNADWNLMWGGKVVKTVKAKEIWDILVVNALKCGEPGILNLGLMREMSNSQNFNPIESTNPCLTGDTKIALADGRGDVSIKELAEEGRDVPVYTEDKKGRVTVRMMRNPRVTGYSQEIFKITLDSGDSLRTTGNHKFVLSNGSIKEAKDLRNGDSLGIMTKLKAKFNEVVSYSNSESKDYYWINSTHRQGWIPEHRFIVDFYRGLPKGGVVHHKDGNPLNNQIDNLEIMSKKEHDAFHAKERVGDNNPMRRFPHKNWRNNPEKQAEMRAKYHVGAKRSDETKRKISIKAKERFADQALRDKTSETSKRAYLIHKDNYLVGLKHRAMNQLKECQSKTDLPCFLDENTVMVSKVCEECGVSFSAPWARRECGYCSIQCSTRAVAKRPEVRESLCRAQREKSLKNSVVTKKGQIKCFLDLKHELGRVPFKKEWEQRCAKDGTPSRVGGTLNGFKTYGEVVETAATFNHRVISVESCGYEDVYNGTVDEFHNFYIGGFVTKVGDNEAKVYINSLQCGEIPLGRGGSCCLGSINISNFCNNGKFDRDGFKHAIEVGVRFLDNILSINDYPLEMLKATATDGRRIGLGIMGLHYAMLKLGIKYSSEEGVAFIEKVFEILRNHSYWISSELAKEKGSFEKYDPEYFLRTGFVKTLPSKIREKIRNDGIRNVTLNTIPPTGTTSILAGVSSGLEPIFAPLYERRYWSGDERKMEIVADTLFEQFKAEGKDTSHFEGSHEVSPESHLRIQEAAQRYIDSAISKTINLPEDYSSEKLSELLLRYIPHLKGVTLYREGSRGDSPLKPLNEKDYCKRTEGADDVAKDVQCASGKCEI